MSNTWILDVLADLRSFALRNDLSALAEQLDDTTLVAATELASKEGGAQKPKQFDAVEHGIFSGGLAEGKNA